MELEEAKKYLEKFDALIFSWSLKEKRELNKAIETVLQALEDRNKQLQEISDGFLKYDWANSDSIQINGQADCVNYKCDEYCRKRQK